MPVRVGLLDKVPVAVVDVDGFIPGGVDFTGHKAALVEDKQRYLLLVYVIVFIREKCSRLNIRGLILGLQALI